MELNMENVKSSVERCKKAFDAINEALKPLDSEEVDYVLDMIKEAR